MSYASVDNVKSLFRDFADNTEAAVTDTEIQEFLDDAESQINSRISTLYVLPINLVDNPKSFAVLKTIEKYLAAGVVDDILNTYSEADKKPMWAEKGVKMLKELVPPKKDGCKQCEPAMKLEDATYIGTSQQRGKITMNSQTGREFVKGGDNW